jgi:hypothetical protein
MPARLPLVRSTGFSSSRSPVRPDNLSPLPSASLCSTFTPQIDRSKHAITTDDLEQDNVLAQRARLFGWIEGQHLDFNDGSEAEARGDVDEAQAIKGYLKFAGQGPLAVPPRCTEPRRRLTWATTDRPRTELLKVNHYKAPRDKLICILNCCKVIFGASRPLITPFSPGLS